MVALDNLNEQAHELENQELEAQGGIATPAVYGQLLAIYLYQFDLCNAKFLWKRIPASIKTQNVELTNIWNVGKAMWQRDVPSVYSALNNTLWSENIEQIMTGLKDKVREKCIGLVCKAYSSISVDKLALLLGMSNSDVIDYARTNEWRVEENIVFPVQINNPCPNVYSTEQQLQILTNFVSFLEN